MKRVTLTIEDDKGGIETYAAEGNGRFTLALVLRVTNAAIGAHPGEIAAVTEAARLIASALASCAGVGAEPSPVPSASESTP